VGLVDVEDILEFSSVGGRHLGFSICGVIVKVDYVSG